MWHVIGSDRIFHTSNWRKAESRLEELNVRFCCRPTSNSSDIQREVDSALNEQATHFVAAGGDGAANLLINSLFRHAWRNPPTIGFLPLGTGCDFIRTFDIPKDPAAAASRLSEKHSLGEQLCDVGTAEGAWGKRYFLNVATVGLTAAAVQRASQTRWLGAARYLFGFFTALPTFKTRRIELRSESGTEAHHGTQAVVANGRFFGGGFEVGPDAKTNDGQLYVMVAAANRWQMIRVFQQVRFAKHVASPRLHCTRTNNLTIDCDIPAPVEVDGDYLGVTPATFSVSPLAIRVRT